MTHSEMTHWLECPEGVGFSSCPGEMIESDLSTALAEALINPPRRTLRRSELWHCSRCGYTIVAEVDARGSRRVRNGYPEPSFPELRVLHP